MMSPVQVASAGAVVATLLAALVPADRVSDRQARSWLPGKWGRYRAKLLAIQLVATLVLAVGAHQIGWTPEDSATSLNSVAQGVAWSVAAVALLRADFPGFRTGEATPGFSVLRAISNHLTEDFNDDLADAVRSALPQTVDDTKRVAFRCKSRAHPPRQDGTRTPDAKALAAAIELLAEEENVDDLHELIVDTVIRHKLPKCWSP